jgi:multidrug resistance efflux pump
MNVDFSGKPQTTAEKVVEAIKKKVSERSNNVEGQKLTDVAVKLVNRFKSKISKKNS